MYQNKRTKLTVKINYIFVCLLLFALSDVFCVSCVPF